MFGTIFKYSRNYTVRWRRNFVLAITKKNAGNILDIGSGLGFFANSMQKKKWITKTIEFDEDARKQAMEMFGLETLPITALYELKEKFDVITLWHVLEHVHDLHGYWQQFSRLLATDGFLFIAVPNFESFDATHYKTAWDAYDTPRHLYHFAPNNIKALAEQYNFEIILLKATWWDAYYTSLLSEQNKHGKKRWLSAALRAFQSNYYANKDMTKSSALVYILQKKK